MRTIDVFGVLRSQRLGGMLEDYQNEINNFKSIMEKANPPNPGAYGYTPPPSHFPPAPPAPPSTPTGGSQGPSGATGMPGDTGSLAPPISVKGGDEIPPPVPTGYGMKPLHPPVSTGIPPGPYPEVPSGILTQPNPNACPSGYHWANGGCAKNPDVPTYDWSRQQPPPPPNPPPGPVTTSGGGGKPTGQASSSGPAPVASIDKRSGLVSAATSLGPSGAAAAAGGLPNIPAGGDISPMSLLGQVRLVARRDQLGGFRPRRVRLVESHSRPVT